jgi:predicted deacylase
MLRRQFEAAARGFGTPFVQIYQDRTPGLLTSRAEELGKITIGTELGWGRCVFPAGVACARRGILTAAAGQGQLDLEEEIPPLCPAEDQILVDTSDFSSTVVAPLAGHFEPYVELGCGVEEGQSLGALHCFDRMDEPGLIVNAPHGGYVICLASRAPVFMGRVVALIGRRIEWLN